MVAHGNDPTVFVTRPVSAVILALAALLVLAPSLRRPRSS
jgi:TctA family transporter